MSSVKKNNFDGLIDNVYQTHCLLQENAAKAVNFNLTVRNWLVGCYIVEYEQNGEDRAKYGTGLLEEIAQKLKLKGIKGLHRRALNTCRIFYTAYPQIWLTLSAELRDMQTLLPIFADNSNIRLTASAKFKDDMDLPPELLLSRLTFSHFIELIRVEDELQRLFYEVESIKNNWNVRELRRAIDTSLAFRTAMSINKEAVIAKIKNLKLASMQKSLETHMFWNFLIWKKKQNITKPIWNNRSLTICKSLFWNWGRDFVLKHGKSVSHSTTNIIALTWFFIIKH
jgi:hypothetical protein